ncbi:MAG: peptidoglycan DD-metalloendopeptidase family protein [Flavobacteriales bacterium]|nr:peptidoglycan DD-metalloendopeptidase family protein [Flavobacteriales bacterium]MCB9365144.1 peptidoglycan DD-metalloendopeptidase family protein [Flavobacteriales bacterium]
MKYLVVLPFLLISVWLKANTFPINVDSSTTEEISTPTTKSKNKKSDILLVNRFDWFVDSINHTLNDTVSHYDWITNDIHFRKFDFSKVEDTLIVLLNDTSDFFTPPFKGNITSEFGKRRWRYHYGIDIDLNTGDTVQSAFGGKVRISTYSKTYGNVVVVRHNNGLETIYAHLSKRLVDIDSTITTGTPLGLGGNTGRSYGSHLHFEVRYFDEPLDPRDLIAFEDFSTHSDTLAISECSFAYRDELKLLNAIQYHKVRSGNTLGHIAAKYGTSISTLCRLNGIRRTKVLQIGERLRVR